MDRKRDDKPVPPVSVPCRWSGLGGGLRHGCRLLRCSAVPTIFVLWSGLMEVTLRCVTVLTVSVRRSSTSFSWINVYCFYSTYGPSTYHTNFRNQLYVEMILKNNLIKASRGKYLQFSLNDNQHLNAKLKGMFIKCYNLYCSVILGENEQMKLSNISHGRWIFVWTTIWQNSIKYQHKIVL